MKLPALCIAVLLAMLTAPGAAQPPPERSVVLCRGDDPRLVLRAATAFATSDQDGVFLLRSPAAQPAIQRFREQYAPATTCTIEQPSDLPKFQPAGAERTVICRSNDRRSLLNAAALAVAARAPLLIANNDSALANFAEEHRQSELLIVAPDRLVSDNVHRHCFTDDAAVLAAAIHLQSKRGPIDTLVLVNPADNGLSNLAPLALRGRNAVLLMTNEKGDDAGDVVRQALRLPGLERVENLLILASPSAIPTERRENPLAGRDTEIEMEPGTPIGSEPYTLAIGRLFHADPAFVALTLARSRLLPPAGSRRSALVASNPGGSLPMLETFSRTSARELAASGYQTTALIGDQLSSGQLRRRLPDADVFLWEGHHNTLIKDWGFTTWSEPLPPSFVFLQSCLALTEDKALPLVERGALAVAGSSSRIYSATGGALSLACLDAMLFERQTLGGAMRSAKNFLLAYGQLKEKRLEQVKFAGANRRSAWAFTLWGDPALRLPAPPKSELTEAAVNCRVAGDTITVSVPPTAQASESGPYRAPYRPNARLAGLLRNGDDGEKRLVPLAFAEVPLPQTQPHLVPNLRSKLSDNNWVFLWDARRQTGWLLVVLPPSADRDFRFHIEWTADEGTTP